MSGRTVAGLEVNLGVRAKEFVTKLNRSKRTIRSFSRATARHFKAITTAATVATAAFAAVAKQGIDAADDIAKSAKNAGLSAEAYQRLSESFRLGGSSAAALTKGNQSLQRSIFDLSRGLSTQRAAFGELGLTYRQLRDLSPEQQFLLVRDRLSEVTDLTTRNALAQQLMGRAGKELGSIMQMTSEQFRAQGQRLQDLGGIIRGDFLGSAEELNDLLSTTGTVIQAQFVNALLTAVQQVQTASGEVVSFDGAIKKIGEVVSRATTAFLDFLRTLYDWRVEIGYGIAAFVALKVVAFSVGAVASIAAVTGAIITFTKSITAMSIAFTAAHLPIIGWIAIGVSLSAALAAIGFAAYTARDALKEAFSQVFEFISAKFSGFILSSENLWLNFRVLVIEAFEAVKETVVKAINAIIEKYNDLVEDLPLPKFDPWVLGSQQAEEALKKVRGEIDANNASLVLTEQAARDAAAAIAEIEFPSVGEIVDQAKVAIGTGVDALKSRVSGSVSSVIPSPAVSPLPVTPTGIGGQEQSPDPTVDVTTFWEKLQTSWREGADKSILPLTESLIESMSGSLSQTIAKVDFKNVGTSLLTSIQTSLQKNVANKLEGLFETFFEGFFSAIKGALGGASSGGGGGLGGLLGSIAGLFGGKAHDGGMVPGGPREEVPILALGGEAVLTREQQKNLFDGGARGQTITQTFNVTGDVTSATRRSMREMADELATQTQTIFNERGLLRT